MSQDTEQLAGESQATTNTILLVEDDPNISSFLVEAIGQGHPIERSWPMIAMPP